MRPQRQADAAPDEPADHAAPDVEAADNPADDTPHHSADGAAHNASDHPAHAGGHRHGRQQLTMRITVTSGERQVHIQIKGSGRKKLADAEATALRLLADTPAPEPKKPIGFSVAADTEVE